MITVAAAIIEKDHKYLAARKKAGLHLGGYWEFPGGKVEEIETPRECLQRELLEELGIHCDIGEYLGESVYDYGSKHIRLIGYFASAEEEILHLTDHDKICWLPPANLKTVQWAPADIPLVEMIEAREFKDITLQYYNSNAADYIRKTKTLDMSALYKTFTSMLPDNCKILDLGCGSGRDSKFFIDNGYRVTAIDPSKSLAEAAADYLGQNVGVYGADELNEIDTYDGIWACSSLIHIHQSELAGTLKKIALAIKPGGILYMSWKLGCTSKWDDEGRYMNPMTMTKMAELLTAIPGLYLLKEWETHSVLANSNDKWLNLIYRKK